MVTTTPHSRFKVFSMLLILALFPVAHAGSAEDCSKLLQKRDATDDLKGFLGELMERQTMGDEGLIRLIEGLEEGKLINPITQEEAWESIGAVTQRKTIQRFMDGEQGKIDQKELLDWSRDALKKRKRVRVERTEAREETRDIHQKIVFHPVKGGKFKMGEGSEKVDVELTHDIEVMSHPVTQKQWAKLMGNNPSKFSGGEGSLTMEVNGKSITMRPDNPVEQVKWREALEFANRLSERHGLKPAYDLSVEGEVSVNAPRGDIYLAEGFRLPTEAEQEYILRAGGTAKGKYHFGNDESKLEKYAWFHKNSGGTTHPVGDRLPLVIEGFEFHDVIGNVREWGWDEWSDKLPLGGKNPVHAPGSSSGVFRVVRGGIWSYFAQDLRSANRYAGDPIFWIRGVGFRLVRTIPNP
ncbi:MAG: formylglycine-generating enzyme family protein [Bacteriovoracales bacterium]|nr:formylglycine-generating enzyme family protein [Bacteriovoracales bacterium]